MERRGRKEGEEKKNESVCAQCQSQNPTLQIAFSFILFPGKDPIKIASIENGRVIATGSFNIKRLLEHARAALSFRNIPLCAQTPLSSEAGWGLPWHLALNPAQHPKSLDWSLRGHPVPWSESTVGRDVGLMRSKLSDSKSQNTGKAELERVLRTTKPDLGDSDLSRFTQPLGNNRSGIRVEVTYSQSSVPAISPCCLWAFSLPSCPALVRGPCPSYRPMPWHCTIFLPDTANSGWQEP